MIRFASLPLLFVGLVLLGALALVAWRRALGGGGTRGRVVRALVVVSGAAFVLSAAGLELAHDRDALTVIAVLDRSRSVTEGAGDHLARALAQLRAASERMGTHDELGLVVVGADAVTELAPTHDAVLPARFADLPRDGSALERGVRVALAERHERGRARILLVSDGLETEGDLLEAAELAQASGVPIDVLPLDRPASPELAVTELRMPDEVAENEPFEIRIGIRSRLATRARLRLTRDGVAIAEGELELRPGEDQVAIREVLRDAGLHTYEATLSPLAPGADGSERNNRAEGVVRLRGPARALAVADDPATLGALVGAVSATGLPVDAVDVASMPTSLAEFARYDAVVLSDVPARSLSEASQRALASYVQDLGGGLLMAGARRSFGLGGYSGSVLERALPATFDLRRRRDRLSLSMVIAIDRSGSMSAAAADGRTKIDIANEAAARSAAMLSPTDRVAVAHVDTEVHWTLPMAAVSDPERAAEACRRADSGGGGIYVDVAMREAYGTLAAERAQLRHFLLFSDGSDSEQLGGTEEQVRRAASQRITTSVVSMGRGVDSAALERLATLGRGRFYIVEDMRELPAVFAEETVAASRSSLVERAFRPTVVVEGPIVRGIDFASGPPLLGLALVTPRADATVMLEAGRDEPLLVVGQRGVGRSAVFTSDLGTEFAAPWTGWSGASELHSQLVRAIARRTSSVGRTLVHVDGRTSRAPITVDLLDERGRLDSGRALRAAVAGPGGSSAEISLLPDGVGRYRGHLDMAASGSYFVTVVDERGEVRASTVVNRAAGDEFRGDPTDRRLLVHVARVSGGRVLESAADAFGERLGEVRTFDSLSGPLGGLALLLYLASIALRRVERLPRLRRAHAEPAADRPTGEVAPDDAPRRDRVAARPGEAASAATGGADLSSPSDVGDRGASEGAQRSEGADASASSDAGASPTPPRTLAEELLARRRRR